MSYRSLEKLSYATPGEYSEIYHRRFHSESAVHLDFHIGEFPAFFVVTPEAASLVAKIYKSDKSISNLRRLLPGVAISQFTDNALIEEILLTNNIEGVYSTRREIEDVLDSLEKADKRKRFFGLVQKYNMLQTSDDLVLETPKDIRDIYDELVLPEVLLSDEKNVPDGEIFRKEEVVVHSVAQKEIHRGLFPEHQIISSMEKALAFLNDESIQLMFRIAIFHYLFGYIHPFYDGNGRTSRFISSYLLSLELDPLSGYRLSYTIKESINEYYKAFRICNSPRNRGDLTPFLLTFLQLIAKSMEQLVSALTKRLRKYTYYEKECVRVLALHENEKLFSLYDLLIQAALFSTQGIPAEEMCRVLHITKPTLSKRLKEISPNSLLDIRVDDHKKYYSLNLNELDKLITPN